MSVKLRIGAAAALLAGCGGSQLPIGASEFSLNASVDTDCRFNAAYIRQRSPPG